MIPDIKSASDGASTSSLDTFPSKELHVSQANFAKKYTSVSV